MLNQIKIYNQLLDLLSLRERDRDVSLRKIFDRDIQNNPNFAFEKKQIHPTPKDDGQIALDVLFLHLTRTVDNMETKSRVFDIHRSARLHWIRYHVEKNKANNMLYFSTREPQGIKTYIYDIDERYVIVLEPLRNGLGYYLLSAHLLIGKDEKRDKILQKYKRKLDTIY